LTRENQAFERKREGAKCWLRGRKRRTLCRWCTGRLRKFPDMGGGRKREKKKRGDALLSIQKEKRKEKGPMAGV